MGEPIIEIKNITVKYITGDLRNIGLKEFFMRKLTRNYHVESFMALDGISFALEKGDMLGIVGTNGAGKSTLLKIITGIMVPSKGSVTVNGRVVALLELASGFDNDLNLKENAYLRGAMLGYTRKFMDEKYPEIIEFSGLKEFEERPFKQLSSGMKSRIAFSIASMVDPEILILDEVLSVGDGMFREKSEAKMKEIIKTGKATILVSHSIRQIRRLCNKVLWIENGKQIAFGDCNTVCDAYEKFLETKNLEECKKQANSPISETKKAEKSDSKEKHSKRKKTTDNQQKAHDEDLVTIINDPLVGFNEKFETQVKTIENISVEPSDNKYNSYFIDLCPHTVYRIEASGITLNGSGSLTYGIFDSREKKYIFSEEIPVAQPISLFFHTNSVKNARLKFCICTGVHGKAAGKELLIGKIVIRSYKWQ